MATHGRFRPAWTEPRLQADSPSIRRTVEVVASTTSRNGLSSSHTDASDVVLLEGAYSARPELHELLDVLVLLDPPTSVRRQQLLDREGDAYREDWEGRWSKAEDLYFTQVMPTDRFDLVIN